MTASNAAEYADSLSATIRAMSDAGAPFGWTNETTGEWTGDQPDGWGTDENGPWTEASAIDYFSDVLDIHYLVNSDGSYRHARICIALGGPTAWIDTRTEELEVAWGFSIERRTLPGAFIDGLDDALDEFWHSR